MCLYAHTGAPCGYEKEVEGPDQWEMHNGHGFPIVSNWNKMVGGKGGSIWQDVVSFIFYRGREYGKKQIHWHNGRHIFFP